MTTYYRFDCGCRWPVVGPPPREGALPLLDVDDDNLPFCPATWLLLGRGDTKGVFQLESSLGRTWTKKLKPSSGEHMGALGALLRPGCLRAVDDEGVSMTERYVRVKNGLEQPRAFHPAVDWILAPTYGCLVFQEQAMEIAKAVAGFSLMDADALRKAIGKKLPEEMAKVRKMFIEGAAKAGVVSTEQAETLFGWIEASQRYSFNKSHAICYGLEGYDTAYAKAHGPVAYYAAWLGLAHEKPDPLREVYELVMDARLNGVNVLPPDLRTLEPHVSTDGVEVRFGLSDVKGVGEGQVRDAAAAVAEAEGVVRKPLRGWGWADFLLFASQGMQSTFVKGAVQAGGLDWTGVTRRRMLFEYDQWCRLTDAEREWVAARELVARGTRAVVSVLPDLPPEPALVDDRGAKVKGAKAAHTAWLKKKAVRDAREAELRALRPWEGLASALRAAARRKRDGGPAATDDRVRALSDLAYVLENPGSPLEDTPGERAYMEESLLGVALTASRVDDFDASDVNATCKEFADGRSGYMVFGVTVEDVRVVRTKKGKNPGQKMAFLTVADRTCSLADVVCFSDAYREFGGLITQGACVLLLGERDRNTGSLVVKKAAAMRAEGDEPGVVSA